MRATRKTPLRKALVLTLILLSAVACSKKKSTNDNNDGTNTVHQAGVSSTRNLGALLDGLEFLALVEKNTPTAPTDEKEKAHFNSLKELLKDLEKNKAVRTQAIAELELECILLKSNLATLSEKTSLLKKDLASFLGSLVPISFDGIKLAYEEKIIEKLGTDILYNKDATDPLAIYLTGKMQCASGTEFFNLARLYSLPSELHAVWIYTPGHVLPGFIRKSGEAFELDGIETTALGVAKIRYGTLTAIDEPVRIVHADLATLLDLVQPYVSKEDLKELSFQALKNTATFYQLPLGRLNQSIDRQIEASMNRRSAGNEPQITLDESENPLAFGSTATKEGDQPRYKVHPHRPGPPRPLNRYRGSQGEQPSLEVAYPITAQNIPKEGKWVLVGKESFDDKLKQQGITPRQKILGDGHDLKNTNLKLLSIDENKVCYTDEQRLPEAIFPKSVTVCVELNPTTNLFELYVEGEPPHTALATYVLRAAAE